MAAAKKLDVVTFDPPYPKADVGTTGYELQVPAAKQDGTGHLCRVSIWNGSSKFTHKDVAISDVDGVNAFLDKVAEQFPDVASDAGLRQTWFDACTAVANNLDAAIAAELKRKAAAAPAPTSQATRMADMAQASAELFHTSGNEAYATFPVGNHRETWPLGAQGFRMWLAHQYYTATGATPGSQAIQDAINTLSGHALFTAPELEIHVRVARDVDGAVWLDLANAEWQAVRIDAKGWAVVDSPTVRFRRSSGMQALPVPLEGGSLDDLRQFTNTPSDDDWKLRQAWLIGALNPRGPYVLLYLTGQQGSVKSFSQKLLRRILDPNVADLRAAPREEVDLLIAARNGWVVGYDNLSHLPKWLSDAFCRLASGAGFGGRQLFTNLDESLMSACRPILFNGITELVLESDLVDRTIIQAQPRLEADNRRTEEDLLAAFQVAHPRILGGLCDIVSGILGELPNVRLAHLPRMADFARWTTAAETVLGWEPGEVLDLFEANQARAQHVVAEGSLLGTHLMAWFRARTDTSWTGTATVLLFELNMRLSEDEIRAVQRPRSGWPSSSTWLSNMLRRLAPTLRITDQLAIDFDEKARPRQITIAHIEHTPDLEGGRIKGVGSVGASKSPDLNSKTSDASTDAIATDCVGDSVGAQTANLSSKTSADAPNPTHVASDAIFATGQEGAADGADEWEVTV